MPRGCPLPWSAPSTVTQDMGAAALLTRPPGRHHLPACDLISQRVKPTTQDGALIGPEDGEHSHTAPQEEHGAEHRQALSHPTPARCAHKHNHPESYHGEAEAGRPSTQGQPCFQTSNPKYTEQAELDRQTGKAA